MAGDESADRGVDLRRGLDQATGGHLGCVEGGAADGEGLVGRVRVVTHVEALGQGVGQHVALAGEGARGVVAFVRLGGAVGDAGEGDLVVGAHQHDAGDARMGGADLVDQGGDGRDHAVGRLHRARVGPGPVVPVVPGAVGPLHRGVTVDREDGPDHAVGMVVGHVRDRRQDLGFGRGAVGGTQPLGVHHEEGVGPGVGGVGRRGGGRRPRIRVGDGRAGRRRQGRHAGRAQEVRPGAGGPVVAGDLDQVGAGVERCGLDGLVVGAPVVGLRVELVAGRGRGGDVVAPRCRLGLGGQRRRRVGDAWCLLLRAALKLLAARGEEGEVVVGGEVGQRQS